jgi:hypothetical protein
VARAGFYWPAFNVADSAISVGAVLMAWDQFAASPGRPISVALRGRLGRQSRNPAFAATA